MSKQIAGKLIVITGKTASGKDTIISRILAHYPNLKRIVTTTSRTMREGERDGVEYHFISRANFEQEIKNNEFLEYVKYGGNFYGTQRKEFSAKTDTLWKIDPSRAGRIRELINSPAVVIYINTSDDAILPRLRTRGLSEEEIKKRMADDKKIWQKYKDKYDYVIENFPGKLDQTIKQIVKIIESHC